MRYNEFEEEITKKNTSRKRRAGGREGQTAFLMLIIGLLTGSFVVTLLLYYTGIRKIDELYKLMSEGTTAQAEASDSTEIKTISVGITDEEVLTDDSRPDEVQEDPEILENEEKRRLNDLKQMLLNGESAVKGIRAAYPDELVGTFAGGGYYFEPINKDLAMNDYTEDYLQIGEDGEYIYQLPNGDRAKLGIDVSKYQGEINWEEVAAANVKFAFIRAGIRGYESGKLVMDENFIENVRDAKANGIEVGVYFFSQAINKAEAYEEAEMVLEALEGEALEYPIALDIEHVKGSRRSDFDKQELTDISLAFIDKVNEAGYRTMIYGNLDTFARMLDISRLEDVDKWFAYYDTDFYFPYQYSIWQYSESGYIPGIEEKVDLNLDMGWQ